MSNGFAKARYYDDSQDAFVNLRNKAGDLFLGTLTTGLAAVILGLDVLPAVTARVSEFLNSSAREKRRVYLPDPSIETRAVIVTAHGTTQHAGSFQKIAEHLTAHGYVVVAIDLRGHGQHYHGAKGRVEVDYEKSVLDLVRTFKQVRSSFPDVPVFCIGESVGASVAIRAVGTKSGLVDGLVLCSTGDRPYMFDPRLVVPDFVKGIFTLDHPMDVTRYIDRYSSDDKRVSAEMIGDPLSRIAMTPRELLRTAWFLRGTSAAARRVDPKMPVLIVQGSYDGIVAKHGVSELLKNLRSRKKEVVVLPGAGHVLMGTSYVKPAVVESLINWLEACTSAPAKAY